MRLSLFHTLSLRHLKLRWSRALMVIASIALGVATMVATRALNRSMQEAMKNSTHPLEGMAELVVSNGDLGVQKDLASEVKKVAGVSSVMPLLIENVLLPDVEKRAVLIAADVTANSVQENPWEVTIDIPDRNKLAAFFAGRNLVLIGKELEKELLAKLTKDAKTFRIKARGDTLAVPLWLGTIEAKGAAASLAGNVIYMDAEVAAKRLGQPGLVSRLDITLDKNYDLDQVRQNISDVLDGRAAVRTPQEFEQFHRNSIDALQLGFSFCGAGALVVGLFLVYNVLSVSVAERRHEIGILRSLGATRPQVCGLFLGEAAILGLLGAAVGLPLGIGLAHLGLGPVLRVFSDLFAKMDAPGVAIGADTLALAAASGVITALLAAWVPAHKASKEQPANAVRRNPPPADLAHLVLQLASGLACIVVGLLCMLLADRLPKRWGNYGFLVGMVLGLLLLTPMFSSLIAQAMLPAIRRLFGIETRLAADNLVRSPGRTGLVITALAAGVGMVLQTSGVIKSNQDVVSRWVDSTILADLVVSSGSPLGGGGQSGLMKDDVATDVARASSDIAYTMPVRFRQLDFRGSQIYLIAMNLGDYHTVATQRQKPVYGLEHYPKVAEKGTARIIVSENFAALYHVKPGEKVTFPAQWDPKLGIHVT